MQIQNAKDMRFMNQSISSQNPSNVSVKESVWDYPRPPRVESVPEKISIQFAGEIIVESTRAIRVLETSHPPTYYIPKEDFLPGILTKASGQTFCEWKGNATYWTITLNNRAVEKVAWSYETPTPPFKAIQGYIAVYSAPMDGCFVGDEQVESQKSNFYGGWITKNLTGPFK